jgi:hypothetical protein
MFISGVNDTGDKLFGSVSDKFNDTADYICHGFSLIGGALIPAINLSPVSLTPLKNDRR